jgi:hypothetical protein
VIHLDDDVEKSHLPEFGKPPELTGTFHSLRRSRIGGVLVDRDGPQIDRMRLLQGPAEEPSGGCRIPLG